MVPPVIRPPMFGSTPGSELSSRTGSRPRDTIVSIVEVSSTEVRTAVDVCTPIGSAVTVRVSLIPALSVTMPALCVSFDCSWMSTRSTVLNPGRLTLTL